MYWGGGYEWRLTPAGEKRRRARKDIELLNERGETIDPVTIEGTAIARTFWGKSWCKNLERYSDYSNRLPRGRSYVRHGAVVDLKIEPGKVVARVSGTDLYTVNIAIKPLDPENWQSVCRDCAGGIDSLVELLQGRLSKAVMERVCEAERGLFPAPKEIKFGCSCPDWASMCKHVAAVLYGVGARLDRKPELLFRLRKVDEAELIAQAGAEATAAASAPEPGRVLQSAEVADLFGLELEQPAAMARPGAEPGRSKARRQAAARRVTEEAVSDAELRAKVIREVRSAFEPYRIQLDRFAELLDVLGGIDVASLGPRRTLASAARARMRALLRASA